MQRSHFRSIFISDVHLGTRDCRADYLLDFLRHTRCERLYLVGDIIDLEALARAPYWPPLHGRVLAELLEMARSGTRVTYLPGNHDAPLRGLHGQATGGIEVRLRTEHTCADGRRLRISHGDEFDPAQLGRTWLTWLGERAHRALCAANRAVNALRRRLDLPYLPLSILAKGRFGQALDYIQRFEAIAAARARGEGFDGQVCGHIHFGNLREVDGTLYLNDGDWVQHCTALVEHAEGCLELLHWNGAAASLGRVRAQAAPGLRAAA